MAREQAEHFWPWKPNADWATPSTAAVDVGVGVDDDGVLAAHLENGALDPDLAGGLRGRDLLMSSPTSREPVKAM